MANIDIKQNIQNKFRQPLADFYKRRIVFWKDSEKEFESTVDELKLDNVKIVKLTSSNSFSVKKQLLVDEPETNFLVYDTSLFDDPKDNWMWDIELYSEMFRADYLSTLLEEMNIAQHPSLRNAVKEYSKFFDNKDRKNAYRQLCTSTDDLKTLHLGIISVLTNTKTLDIHEVLLQLFKKGFEENDNELFLNIVKFGNVDVFWKVVNRYTGYAGTSLNELAKSVLLTALAQTIDPEEIKKYYGQYLSEENIGNCYDIVNEWYNSPDVAFVKKMITDVGRELRIVPVMLDKLTIPQIAGSDIFPHVNGNLVTKLLTEIKNNIIRTEGDIDLIERRRSMRWYKEYLNYFEGIYYIAKMQAIYQKYQNAFHMVSSFDVWRQYSQNSYLFDTYYRKFHYYFQESQKHTNVHVDDDFKECADYIENLYTNWYLKNLSDNWISSAGDELAKYGKIQGAESQTDFYYRNVEQNLGKKITFVIISDAMRYEVGKELYDQLSQNARANVKITPVLSVFPSVTEFGMAALLPGRKLVRDDGMITSYGIDTNSTEKRQDILRAECPESIAITYEDFQKMKQSERGELIKGMKVVYIYHNDIDARGDKAISEKQVFDACNETIEKLNNLVQVITSLRASSHIVITADHGFMYNYKPIAETNKISKADLSGVDRAGRRYVVGDSSTSSPYLQLIKLLINDKNDSYIGLAPKDIVRIKMAGGGENYVHGGISLQEMMIPVITYDNVRADSKEYQQNSEKYSNSYAKIQLVGDNRKISNSIFTLNFYQNDIVGGNIVPATYEIYMVNVAGKPVSDVKTVVADKEDKDSSNRQFKVRMNLKPIQFSKTELYYLMIMNKESGQPLERIEYQINITFTNDFDF